MHTSHAYSKEKRNAWCLINSPLGKGGRVQFLQLSKLNSCASQRGLWLGCATAPSSGPSATVWTVVLLSAFGVNLPGAVITDAAGKCTRCRVGTRWGDWICNDREVIYSPCSPRHEFRVILLSLVFTLEVFKNTKLAAWSKGHFPCSLSYSYALRERCRWPQIS